MSVEDIYFELENLPLTGEILIEDGHLKWKYDSLMIYSGDDLDEHLEEVYLEDKEMIDELLVDVLDEVSLTLPEFEDTWVYFYIEK
jgi:hypothetical protein